MLKQSFLAADSHSAVGVKEQARETRCEITYKIIWDRAQRLLHLQGQFSVMMFLEKKYRRVFFIGYSLCPAMQNTKEIPKNKKQLVAKEALLNDKCHFIVVDC